MHLRLERHAGDDVLEILLSDLVVGFIDQAATYSFDNVGAKRTSLQAGGVCHQDMQIPLLEFLNILLRGGVGDDDLSA